uniref:G protein-coupled receptor n=1 Tax=Steinernema glaseri TaxID=37863 RepID=A0A1I8AUS3_9BILA
MERYLFRPDEYARYYNCSLLTYAEWSAYAEKRPILGTVCITVGAINLMTYLPCLYVIRKPMFFKHSCFKIMFFLGLMDCSCVLFNSFLTGYFHIVGSVFCLTPNLQYISGCFLNACWFGECFGCALLAFNRCGEFVFPQFARTIFHKNKTYIWIVIMYLYPLVAFVYEVPVILNSRAIMWTFDAFIIFPPDLLPIDHTVFISYMNDYNNRILLGSMILSYLALIVALAVKGKGLHCSGSYLRIELLSWLYILLTGDNTVHGDHAVCVPVHVANGKRRGRTHTNLLQQVDSLGSEKFISKAVRYPSKQRQQHRTSSAVKRKNRSE